MTIKHLYPTVTPSLNLDFANSKKLDPRIDFQRASIGTYVGANGLIEYAAAGEARFDHDLVTGESLGLLIEESRANLLTYSEELDTIWFPARLDVLAFGDTGYVSAVSPDGVTYATYWRPTIDANRHQNVQAPSVSAGNHTLSFFIKADPGGYYRFGVLTSNPSSKTSIFNAATGTIELDQHGNAEMQPLPNGWYRVSVTSNANAGSFQCIPYVYADNGNEYAAGDGVKGMWVWGAQLEAGPFLTSYIPTTSSAVTRAADVVSLTGSNFSSWYNQSGGTYFLDATTVDSGTTDDILYDGYVTIRDYIGAGIRRRAITSPLVGGVYQFSFDPAQAPVSKVAVAFDSTSANAAYAGVLQTLDTSISDLPNSATSLTIGGTGPSQMNKGHISRLTYYPVRLPDTTLQALTL